MATAYDATLQETLYPLDYTSPATKSTPNGLEESTAPAMSAEGEVRQNTGTAHSVTPGTTFDVVQSGAQPSWAEAVYVGDTVSVRSTRDVPDGLTVSAAMRDAFTVQISFTHSGAPVVFDPADVGGASTYFVTGESAEVAPITATLVSYDHVNHPAYLYLSLSSPPITGKSYSVWTDNEIFTDLGLVTGFTVSFTATEWGRTSTLKSFMPTALDPAQPNLNALLTALGYGDEWLGGAYPGAGGPRVRLGTTVSDAIGDDLNRVGTSYSIPRPTMFSDDETYRAIIGYLGVSKKATRDRVSEFLTATLGSSWALYELEPAVLTLALDVSGVTGAMESASYLHADATTDSTDTYYGDYLHENFATPGWPERSARVFAGDARQLQAIELLKHYMLAAGVQLRVIYNIIPTNNNTGLPSVLPFDLPNT